MLLLLVKGLEADFFGMKPAVKTVMGHSRSGGQALYQDTPF